MAIDCLFLTPLNPEEQNELELLKRRISSDLNHERSIQLLDLTRNPQVISQLLLYSLQTLDEPVLTYDLYHSFIMTHHIIDPIQAAKYQNRLIKSMPAKYATLATQLLTLLHRLSLNQASNHLTPNILASLFHPYLLRSKQKEILTHDEEELKLAVTFSLIDNYELIFGEESSIIIANPITNDKKEDQWQSSSLDGSEDSESFYVINLNNQIESGSE